LNNPKKSNQKRYRSHLAPSIACNCCSCSRKDTLHILQDCPYSHELWLRMGVFSYNILVCDDIKTWVYALLSHKDYTLLILVAWWAWSWRNNVLFSNQQRMICLGYAQLAPLFVKINVDESWIHKTAALGIGGLIRDDMRRWATTTGLSHSCGVGYPLLVKLLAVKEDKILRHAHAYHIHSIRDLMHQYWIFELSHILHEMGQCELPIVRSLLNITGDT
ncbi:putative ribonuclease H protein, partial [Mucuna pruriens]